MNSHILYEYRVFVRRVFVRSSVQFLLNMDRPQIGRTKVYPHLTTSLVMSYN